MPSAERCENGNSLSLPWLCAPRHVSLFSLFSLSFSNNFPPFSSPPSATCAHARVSPWRINSFRKAVLGIRSLSWERQLRLSWIFESGHGRFNLAFIVSSLSLLELSNSLFAIWQELCYRKEEVICISVQSACALLRYVLFLFCFSSINYLLLLVCTYFSFLTDSQISFAITFTLFFFF